MNFITSLLSVLALTGVSSADTVCQTNECKATADLITSSIDKSVDPCENFYEYACGTWKKNHPLTAANIQTGVSHFGELQQNLIGNLINNLEKSSVKTDSDYLHPLINFYKGCVDNKGRDSHESRDLNVVRSVLKKVGGWPLIDEDWDEDSYDAENALIEMNKMFQSKVVLSIDVMTDIKNNSLTIVSLTNPFTSSGLKGIYKTPNSNEHRVLKPVTQFYSDYYAQNPVQTVAEAVKGSPIDAKTWNQDMLGAQMLSNSLEKAESPIVNDIDYFVKNYDSYKISLTELKKYRTFNYRKIIDGVLKQEGIQLKDDDKIFVDKEYLQQIDRALTGLVDKRSLANLIGINLAVVLNRFTSTRLALLTGVPSIEYMPQVCLSFASQVIPDLLGRLYLDKMFETDSVEDMKSFIASLKEAFDELLQENTWMDAQTKASAVNKLNAIAENIAFPEYLFNASQLQDFHKQFQTFTEDNFLGTMLKALGYQRSLNSKALRFPEPTGHWPTGMSSVVVNAFYSPEVNGIFFPAGIAQFPFYQHTRPRPLNLGAIGMVISHELTHAFDNTGSLFDEKGNLHNWITNTSKNVFNQKAQCFVDQYNKFKYNISTNIGSQTVNVCIGHSVSAPDHLLAISAITDSNLNGLRTLGENIADNGGVRIAYRALELYKKRNSGKESRLPGDLKDMSDEKLFFLSFANIWCSNKGPAALNAQIQRDVHSVEDARVIATLANFPEFSNTFNCKTGSKMNPNNKCVLWG